MKIIINNSQIIIDRDALNVFCCRGKTGFESIRQAMFEYYRNDHLKLGVIDQNATMLQTLNVYDNMLLPYLYHFDVHSETIADKADKLLKKFDINCDMTLFPGQVSLSDKKMICIIRSLLLKPETLLIEKVNDIAIDILKNIFSYHQSEKSFTILVTEDYLFSEKLSKHKIPFHIKSFENL